MKINEAEVERKFEKMISRSSFQDIENVVIVKTSSQEYHLFGRYTITKKDPTNVVVTLHNGDVVNSFYSTKSAVCWCVFDKRGLYSSANRIIELDRKLSGLEVSISIHKRLFNQTSDQGNKLIFLAKLNEERIQKREMTDELNRHITDSYNWQQKQYDLKSKQ